ncbi:molybdopterin-dependent oxidoreductase [Streptomyces sp. NPDC002516]
MASDRQGTADEAADVSRRVPPGQRLVNGWPVSHYGPVPRFRPERWNLRVFGATADGAERGWTFDELTGLPHVTVVADLHCATGPTSTDHEWYGIPATSVLDLVPPAAEVTHVMAWWDGPCAAGAEPS